ncbi:beta-glucosidase BglX [Flavihumibacter petaseus]|uniref:Periplasmic beta-glucosidase n=1 Tax=Flavihumibacter petaseus NBRC 106054 TaxID=1220578 RepID=A0A0E9MYH0_9BACT|nr:beta-glucosidase BglX [Flavihumibacter petaseus]GAO42782.1 beta-glucosidase BglX [Flavihumibacter petaseus NBRC 106054]
MKIRALFLLGLLAFAIAGFAQQPPFYADIQAFKQLDRERKPEKNGILLIGSSSFTYWKDVNSYFPGYPITNRGFGGSSLPDLIRYADDIVDPYAPEQILIYCGENDFAGATDTLKAATVVNRFKTLYGILRAKAPQASIVYVSMKASPSRRKYFPKIKAANKAIADFLKTEKNTGFIDVFPIMLNANGQPKPEIFRADSLHMNEKGYAIWQKVFQPVLLQTPQVKFINDLLGKMTIEEKIGQLNLVVGGEATTGSVVSTGVEEKIKKGAVGGIFSVTSPDRVRKIQEIAMNNTRLKIPIIFGLDVIHGYKTIFPIPLGLSCSWDMALIESTARTAAQEASADGLNWTFSPMVDIARDPRWGRIAEGSGEDPFLGSAIARAMVKGYQGDDLQANNTLMACVKHYALYGAAEGGRDYNTVDMSHARMFNDYFPPYKAAVDAGVGTVMASFNDIDGIPATANKWLLTDVLRNQWGFNGLVVSDYTGVSEMIAHGIGDLQHVSAQALKAGLDMDMVSEGFLTTLGVSLKSGKVTEAEITEACRRVLEMKYRLGLFQDPYKYCDPNRAKTEIFTHTNRALARAAAARSSVLLKNNRSVLPLAKKGRIALVGPLANSRENLVGTWAVSADYAHPPVSLYTALQSAAGSAGLLYAKGANISEDSAYEARVSIFGKKMERDTRSAAVMIDEAVKAAAQADVVIAALGETAEMTGESSSRSLIGIPESQLALLRALKKTGKPVVVVLFTGRPLVLTELEPNADAILNVWFGGSEAAPAIADLLFGDANPSGKLTTSFPRNEGQIPIYYAHRNTGRPLEGEGFQKFRSNYLDVSNEPLYPFGYGLSYSNFTYGEVELSSKSLRGDQTLTATVTVTNTGKVVGEEVVQLYLRDVVASNTRPLKELKGFKKISLAPGASQKVSFTLTTQDLKFYNNELKYDWEAGAFVIFIGGDSKSAKGVSVQWEK